MTSTRPIRAPSGLGRVELERGTDLVHEVLRALHGDAADLLHLGPALDHLAALQSLRDVVLHPEAPGDRERDVAAPRRQDPDEPRHAALVDHDVGDVAPMSTIASSPPSSSSMPTSGIPTARAMAKGTRSTPMGSSFAASATSTTVFTIARCAATRMHAQHPAPLLLELPERVEVQDGLLDRHGDELLSLEAEGGAQLLLREPRQRDLAHHDALVPTPM